MKISHLAFASAVLLGASTLAACSKSAKISTTPDPEPAKPKIADAPVAPKYPDPPDVHIEGDHLTIDQKIHFGHDSDEIMDDSTEILDHIALALKNHTEFAVLHVVGHTDSSGNDAHNLELSQKRAEAVVAALTERGVTQTMDARGAGETELTCTEATDDCHKQNRRVEFIVEKADE